VGSRYSGVNNCDSHPLSSRCLSHETWHIRDGPNLEAEAVRKGSRRRREDYPLGVATESARDYAEERLARCTSASRAPHASRS
jgi:hypothetical protein